MVSEQTTFLMECCLLKGIGKQYLRKIAELFIKESRQGNFDLLSYDFSRILKKQYTYEDKLEAISLAAKQLDLCNESGHRILSILDDEYPDSLRSTNDYPPILFCHGDIRLLKQKAVAVIGARQSTNDGDVIASRITSWFSDNQWAIVSGLAKGIDTVSHKACLSAGGKTIAVLATGLDRVYPVENTQLAEDIVENGGLLITEHYYKSSSERSSFVERDRIQAGLSSAVIMIQSSLQGGSLHASKAILSYGRYLIVPRQSKQDLVSNEPQVQANVVLEFGADSEKMLLLNIPKEVLSHVLIAKTKNDLFNIESMLNSVSFDEKSKLFSQGSLLI